jgi:hypothetical protein
MKTRLHTILRLGIGLMAIAALAFILISRQTRAQVVSPARQRLLTNFYFPQRLVWVGDRAPSDIESHMLMELLDEWTASGRQIGLSDLEMFLAAFPSSPWAPSLHANLGQWYRSRGQSTIALEHLVAAWESSRVFSTGDGKRVADFSLAHYTRLLMVLGRTDILAAIYQSYGNYIFKPGPLQQMWLRTREKYGRMLKYPGDSYVLLQSKTPVLGLSQRTDAA